MRQPKLLLPRPPRRAAGHFPRFWTLTMPEVGDRVRVRSRKVGQAEREGVVTQVMGHLLRVQWSTGEESMFTPGPGSITVVGKVRFQASKTASTEKTGRSSTNRRAKKATVKKDVPINKKKDVPINKKAAPKKFR